MPWKSPAEMAAAEAAAAEAEQLCGQLSERMREVLVLMSKGLSAREIGTALGISMHTAHELKQRIFQRLQVHKAVEAAVIAVKAGLV